MAFARKLFSLPSALLFFVVLIGLFQAAYASGADGAGSKKKDAGPPDVIVFTNGDQLSGKFLREVGGTVFFHSDIVGDLSAPWDKVKELRSSSKFAVLQHEVGVHTVERAKGIAVGTIGMTDGNIHVQPSDEKVMIEPIPVKSAQYIVDQATFDRQLRGAPGFFAGWNGSVTAGTTIIQATQNQYTFTAEAGLARIVPTVLWLDTRNRTTMNYSQTYGKITDPAYIESDGTYVPSSYTKSSIYHVDAERDQYFSTRFYALAQTAFDHNFSQGLSLQQIYGAGIGLTAIKKQNQSLDFKATLQYEKQQFYAATDGTNQNLIGSTFAATYALRLPRSIVFNQQVSYIPAYNYVRAYSASESNTLLLPFYKSLSFTIGTNDSYLNDPPPAEPPTKRNSFQFTTGVTYAIHSKY
ncbi:DUF481 domain-containing protein [Acidobacterium sp. S8]|uniref:DUF481 domain-containing protein n=1 Tax=Acidobacterium sp. S8 TaxID=1641854 RepID=UPI00131E0918|nr:DUF481 domain-containing protein [Acidobacterium sp. S8]